MSALGDIVRKLSAAGVETDVIADVLDSVSVVAGESQADQPSKAALRTRKWRAGRAGADTVTVTSRDVTTPPMRDHSTPPEKIPPSPPSEVQTPRGSTRKANGSTLPDDWQPNDRHFQRAASFGRDRSWVLRVAELMREWAVANRNRPVARKADWDATFGGWLRREDEKPSPRGSPPHRPKSQSEIWRNAANDLARETRDDRSHNDVEILTPERQPTGFGPRGPVQVGSRVDPWDDPPIRDRGHLRAIG